MSTIVSQIHVIKDTKNNLIGLYDPETGLFRQVLKKWKLKNENNQIDNMLDNFFEQAKIKPPKSVQAAIDSVKKTVADSRHVSNKIELEAHEMSGDIILNVFVRGGTVSDHITDSDVTVRGAVVKDLKLNYNLFVDGARVGAVTNSNVAVEGAQLG